MSPDPTRPPATPGPQAVPALTLHQPWASLSRHHARLWLDSDWENALDDQLPFGDFAPGRWAWLLDDVEPLEVPVLAKGRQRVWRWQP